MKNDHFSPKSQTLFFAKYEKFAGYKCERGRDENLTFVLNIFVTP